MRKAQKSNAASTLDDAAEKADIAQMLISLSPSRATKSTQQITPDIRESFSSPPAAYGLWSPPQKHSTSAFGLGDFGSPLQPASYEMSPFSSFAATMLSPLPSSHTPVHPQATPGDRMRGLSSASEFVAHRSIGLSSPGAYRRSPIRAESNPILGMSPNMAAFSFEGRRTKSVITPELRKKTSELSKDFSDHSSEDQQSEAWISVQVSPSLECESDASLGSESYSAERHRYSAALQTINEKVKSPAAEVPPRQVYVNVAKVNAAAQPPSTGKPPHNKKKASHSTAAAAGEDFLHSPPTASHRSSARSAHSRVAAQNGAKASELYTAPTFALPPASPPNGKADEGGPAPRKACNCKNSKCLKLYCDCFASSQYCVDCNCKDCSNNAAHESERQEAVKQTLEKNAQAFQAKITISGNKGAKGEAEHSSGCHCKKSRCLKKYCECFEAAVYCADKCKCLDCENYEGSAPLLTRKAKIRDGRKVTAPINTSMKLDAHLATEAASSASSTTTTTTTTAAATAVAPVKRNTGTRHSGRSLVNAGDATSSGGAKWTRPLEIHVVRFVVRCECPTARSLMIGAFHFLGDGDLHSSSLVCKSWLKTAFDPALWDYEEGNNDAMLM